MSTDKNIFWRPDVQAPEGLVFANVHVLVGYNQGCITDYQEMARLLRQTFPDAKDSDLKCATVQKSSFCKGFSLLIWNAAIVRQTYDGWVQSTFEDGKGGPEYYW